MRRRIVFGLITLGACALLAAMTLTSPAIAAMPHAASAGRTTGAAAGNPFCAKLAAGRLVASAAAEGFCFGPQPSGMASKHGAAAGPAVTGTPRNVDAASLSEDVSPAGLRAYGQAEVSVAAAGPYVVEAWNDSTAFFSGCGSAQNKEEGTGFGFSANGGTSFTDLGGLPNKGCAKDIYGGDPSVAAYQSGGHTYFYISSLFNPPSGVGASEVAMDACQVTGSGRSARLSCGQPVVLGNSTSCVTQNGQTACDFLDKDFITVDPAHHRLYATYTDFPAVSTTLGTNIDASVCDLSKPAAPVCEVNGAGRPAYLTLAPASASPCENEGAYPAADPATGALYVGYEFNLGSNQGYPLCSTAATPTSDKLVEVPLRCLRLAATAACGVSARASVEVTSLSVEEIPGFSRLPTDWPRPAVSDRYRTVTIVWNDTRYHPLGDILMQSYALGTLAPVQRTPVLVDKPVAGGLNFQPALRESDASGKLDVTWFSRGTPATADTNVYGAIGINPRATTAPGKDVRVTNVASNWLYGVSDISPNFGDYTDNYLVTTSTPPYVGNTLYVVWSDGRLGVTQPFEAHLAG